MKRGSLLRRALLLGLLSALGPLAIDLYLPAFPAVAADFRVPAAQVQLSLVSFFVALGVGQLFYGSMSDVFGRRRPLLVGLALFVLASIGCSQAADMHSLIVWRFVQGLGACAGNAIARAVVRDLHTGQDAAKLLSSMLLVLGVSPILAPMAGSLLLTVVSWRVLFWIVAAIVVCVAALSIYALPETLPPQQRHRGGIAAAFRTYRSLLGNGRFVLMIVLCGMCSATTFSFLAGSPFVYTQIYGVSTAMFGPLIGINAAAQILSAQFNRRLMRRLGTPRQIKTASAAAAATSLLLLLLTVLHLATLPVMVLLCSVLFASVGLLMTPSAVVAMDGQGERAGAAGALLGSGQMLTGAAMAGLVGVFADGTAVPLAGVLAACAVTAWALGLLLFRTRAAKPD